MAPSLTICGPVLVYVKKQWKHTLFHTEIIDDVILIRYCPHGMRQ